MAAATYGISRLMALPGRDPPSVLRHHASCRTAFNVLPAKGPLETDRATLFYGGDNRAMGPRAWTWTKEARMTRRRYHARVACGGCGRLLGEQEAAGHERVCAAWRKRLAEEIEPKESDPTDPTEDEKNS